MHFPSVRVAIGTMQAFLAQRIANAKANMHQIRQMFCTSVHTVANHMIGVACQHYCPIISANYGGNENGALIVNVAEGLYVT